MKQYLNFLTIILSLFLFSSCEDKVKLKGQKLIKILKEGSHKERQEAIKELKEIGLEILPELHKCELQAENLEASLQCKLIIADVHKKRRKRICENILNQLNTAMSFDGSIQMNQVTISDMRRYGEWKKEFKECTFFDVGYEAAFEKLNELRDFILAASFPDDSKKKANESIQKIKKDLKADKNNDGLPDEWAKHYGITDPNADPDGDGIKNKDEAKNGTNPYKKDK